MVRLQTGGEAAGQSERVAESRDDADSGGYGYEVLQAHDFGNGRGHFGGYAWREGGEQFRVRVVAEQPVAKFADAHGRDRGEGFGVMLVDNQASYLIILVRDDGFGQKCRKR